mmetsp:Transcript_5345/g.9854  ORF Transcript_5345/g.9854 Transcript_5345/m.9854 type:complete len:203 (+) Transcript_5345:1767-2375(+)
MVARRALIFGAAWVMLQVRALTLFFAGFFLGVGSTSLLSSSSLSSSLNEPNETSLSMLLFLMATSSSESVSLSRFSSSLLLLLLYKKWFLAAWRFGRPTKTDSTPSCSSFSSSSSVSFSMSLSSARNSPSSSSTSTAMPCRAFNKRNPSAALILPSRACKSAPISAARMYLSLGISSPEQHAWRTRSTISNMAERGVPSGSS